MVLHTLNTEWTEVFPQDIAQSELDPNSARDQHRTDGLPIRFNTEWTESSNTLRNGVNIAQSEWIMKSA